MRARGTGGGWPAHGALPAGRRPPRLAHRPSSVPRGTLTHHQRTGRRPDLPTSGRRLSPCRPPSTAAGDTSGRGGKYGKSWNDQTAGAGGAETRSKDQWILFWPFGAAMISAVSMLIISSSKCYTWISTSIPRSERIYVYVVKYVVNGCIFSLSRLSL